jgi:hypothetical protein
VNDSKTVDATVRNIQILGEAANQVPKEFQAANAQIEWTKIIRFPPYFGSPILLSGSQHYLENYTRLYSSVVTEFNRTGKT